LPNSSGWSTKYAVRAKNSDAASSTSWVVTGPFDPAKAWFLGLEGILTARGRLILKLAGAATCGAPCAMPIKVGGERECLRSSCRRGDAAVELLLSL